MSTPSNDSEWKRCRGCRLYSSRRNVVLTRTGYCSRGNYVDVSYSSNPATFLGSSPPSPSTGSLRLPPTYPHLFFIGEAPEAQEDHSGLPFQGPSGRILHTVFSFVWEPFSYTITNVVGCRPTIEDWRGDLINREPSPQEIEACRPRLEQLVNSIHFDGVVYLGKVATSFKPKTFLGPRNLFSRSLDLLHPAAILRMEYKLHTIKQQAAELSNYVKSTTVQRAETLRR